MARKITEKIMDAVYPYEQARRIFDKIYWGDSPEDFNAIAGDIAAEQAEEMNISISGKLNADTMYIFRWNAAKTRLVPYHVSMKPKTLANITKGSMRFGTLSIIAELR